MPQLFIDISVKIANNFTSLLFYSKSKNSIEILVDFWYLLSLSVIKNCRGTFSAGGAHVQRKVGNSCTGGT